LKTKLKLFKRGSSGEIVNAKYVRDTIAIAFSGIGNPKSFDELLVKENVKILKHIAFSDHHWYTEKDITRVIDARKQTHADFIITTEKDAVRLREEFSGFLETEPVIIAEIQQEIISGEQTFAELLQRMN
jgi:tetraacyldisaccharide 4'-kinase